MAGVFGFIDPTGKARPEETLERLGEAIRFSARERIDGRHGARSALGVLHLGLLHHVSQPVRDEATGARLVLDGEITEPERLAARLRGAGARLGANPSEPELLLRLFLDEGPESFRDLDGSWAVAVLREEAGEVTLLTDRFGSRQILWAPLPGGGVAFFPDLKGTLAFDAIEKRLDPRAVADLIAFQYIYGRRTLLSGVELVPPASIARFREGRMETRAYWSLPFPETYPIISEREWVDEYVRLMKRAVEKRTRKAPATGSTLSGGKDTRLIAAATPRDLSEFHTFTFGLRGCHDRLYGREVARAVGAVHHDVDLTPESVLADLDRYIWFTDGMVNAKHGHISILFPLVRRHVDALLEGAPPASLFFYAAGIPGFDILNPVRAEVFLDYYMEARTEVKPEETRGVLAGPFADAFREGPRESVRASLGEKAPAFPPLLSARVGIRNRLPRFTNTGARYMRAVMEVRQPFCDYDLFDYAVTIPGKLFVDREVYHRLIRRHFPELSRIGCQGPGLPADPTLWQLFWKWRVERGKRWIAGVTGGRARFAQRKRTFDYDTWLRGPFRSRAERDLRADLLGAFGVADPKGVARLAEEHFNGRIDRTRVLWPLLTLENWLRQFFEGERPEPFDG
ncbi:MAG: hypothetical protein JW958_03995 [Candidatus Eisenbacteria bacterium]|nr:hypothetical protein [Candidatus Eisenbacteria bacterium]